ncbi:MAG: N-acetylneuraminate synthase [Elusimicrobiota bacterium]
MARKQPRCFVIAEAGVNHNGDLRAARRLVDAARRAGADAVKFQTFKAEKLATASAALAPYQKKRLGGGAQLDMIRRLELSDGDHQRLFEHCAKAGILFLSTPFDEESADMLDRLGVDRFKLPSGELTNKALLRHVAGKGKPLILSTGMSTLAEVRRAVGWIFSRRRVPLTLLHCVTEYPAPADEVNLRAMDTLREAFGLPVGYSDHTLGVEIAVAAAARGAAVIEKHLTLDRRLPGPDQAASLEPEDFRAMVAAIRLVESALGDGVKRMAPCERRNRAAARRSLVAARDLPRGHRLEAKDLLAKRPGTGIPPAEAARLLGRRLRRALRRDGLLRWDLV